MGVRLAAMRALRNAMLGAGVIGLLTGAIDPDFAALRAADQRVADVAHRLQTANVALCPDRVVALPGFTVQTATQFAPRERERARRQLGVGSQPSVGIVARGSAAEQAGLRPGDALLAIDGEATPAESAGRYEQAGATERQIDRAFASPPVALTLADRQVGLAGDAGCSSWPQVVAGGLQRTAADGRYIQISEAMLALAPTDDALAAVVAHELAHNILRHAALKTPSKRAESEADRLSVWLVARAGYDLDAVLPFWERLRKRNDYGILSDGSHPPWKRRIAELAATIAIVKAQKAAGAPLVPPREEGASQAQKAR